MCYSYQIWLISFWKWREIKAVLVVNEVGVFMWNYQRKFQLYFKEGFVCLENISDRNTDELQWKYWATSSYCDADLCGTAFSHLTLHWKNLQYLKVQCVHLRRIYWEKCNIICTTIFFVMYKDLTQWTLCFYCLRMSRFDLHIPWVPLHVSRHFAPPSFYSSLKRTNCSTEHFTGVSDDDMFVL